MNMFWDEEAPFISLFDGHHFIYIFLMVGLLLLLITQRHTIKTHAHKVSGWILFFSIAQQILLYSWYLFETGFDISESLPLHISRISSILGIIYLITKNKKFLIYCSTPDYLLMVRFFGHKEYIPSIMSLGYLFLSIMPLQFYFLFLEQLPIVGDQNLERYSMLMAGF